MTEPSITLDEQSIVEAAGELSHAELCPEIALRLKPTSESFDSFRSRLPRHLPAGPPYWAVAWPGGQALARYLLDSSIVSGMQVHDVGTGCGLVAIAACKSGARGVTASDNDRMALAATRVNARGNGVTLEAIQGDLGMTSLDGAHAVLAGDLWYERHLARLATDCLRRVAQRGTLVLLGDPGRSHFPRARTKHLASYRLSASEEFETGSEIVADVWQLLA